MLKVEDGRWRMEDRESSILVTRVQRELVDDSECFDRLSTNGKYSPISSSAPFALRLSKGERWVFQQTC